MVKALQHWLRLVSWALDLRDYLLPTPAGGVAPAAGDALQPPMIIPHGMPGEAPCPARCVASPVCPLPVSISAM